MNRRFIGQNKDVVVKHVHARVHVRSIQIASCFDKIVGMPLEEQSEDRISWILD